MISGNAAGGIYISGGVLDVVAGNDIGTNAAGTGAIANGNDGVEIANGASKNTIGGAAAGAGNVISGNTNDGVQIVGSGTSDNVVAGNLIGTNVTGTVAIVNGYNGVQLSNDASGNTIGGTARRSATSYPAAPATECRSAARGRPPTWSPAI